MEIKEMATLVSAVAGPLLGATGMWSWLTARQRAKLSAPAQEMRAEADLTGAAAEFARRIGEASASLVEDLRAELKVVRGRCDELATKVDHCETRHGQCEENLAVVRAEIAQLMRENPPAGY